ETSLKWGVPTNTVPLSACAMERAPGRSSAQTSTLKPGGTFSWFTGNSFAGLPVMLIANGWRGDLSCSAERPCCHDGGGVGAAAGLSPGCCAKEPTAGSRSAPSAVALPAARMRRLNFLGVMTILLDELDTKTRAHRTLFFLPARRRSCAGYDLLD